MVKQVMSMALKKHNNIITSKSWSTKDIKDTQLLTLVGVVYKLMAENIKKQEQQLSHIIRQGIIILHQDLPILYVVKSQVG